MAEKISSTLITVGGIGTIVAVVLIFVFLVAVVVPLFLPAQAERGALVEASALADATPPVHLVIDEYGVLAGLLYVDGAVHVLSLASGELLSELRPFDGAPGDPADIAGEQGPRAGPPTSWSISADGRSLALGFADGSIRMAEIGFPTSFPERHEIPEDLQGLAPGEVARHAGGILQLTPEGEFRHQAFAFDLAEPLETGHDAPILALSHVASGEEAVVAALAADGALLYLQSEARTNLLTGETSYRTSRTQLPWHPDGRSLPERLVLTGRGDNLLLIGEGGVTERLDVRRPAEAAVAEIVDLLPAAGAEVAATALSIGQSTLLVGGTDGSLRAWFGTKPPLADTIDGSVWVPGHELRSAGPRPLHLAPSPRSRLLAAGFSDGGVALFHVTTEQELAALEAEEHVGELLHLLVMPKEDGLVVLGREGLGRWELDLQHPEATLGSLFTEVWYEGYAEPAHVWQSEAATDEFEPKFGFAPLVYGTLKATFYSMLFGAPLALLAALFTSEFLERRLRVPLKSTIEIMASLPSVVLGFLAAIIIAPFVQEVIPGTLAVFVTLPLTLLAGAYAWQLLPQGLAIRWAGWPRLVCMAAALPLAVAAASVVGPVIEEALFAGDVELWLDGQIGSSVGGWAMIFFPACALAVAWIGGRWASGWMRARAAHWPRRQAALADVAKFVIGLALATGLALALSWLLELMGLDPRGTFVGTYVQRNALVVGFVMGFAIIPIIYTLAEDALSSVPDHLRQASLGAGATTWQTAVRVIVPTAMSGLFSAVMIGLGRAVGETMIVLMATGNTPVMEMNVFNGFRTLSANIAVELPEAVQGSTHYRTLFLAALVLFAMTFLLNTGAEAVRIRVRRRAYQL